ncbi:Transcription factor MYC/MYB N-terminal, partial [Dillenia turbinata]
MEEHLSPLAVTHLLQHTLRSLCIHENSQWVYAVWDGQGAAYDRILVWEDGFCNFAASTSAEINSSECPSSSVYGNCEFQHYQGLQPELFFKMSHEIYNYGEGLIGKVAADHSHKWVYKEPNDQEINFLSAWHNSADSHPRTWEAQFQSGIKTIALIAVREGVIQLGAVHKVIEDLSYVVLLRKKFSYIESIPGVLLPHPSSSTFPFKVDGYNGAPDTWHYSGALAPAPPELYDHFNNQPLQITPSMSSLEALLSKLPSVVPTPSPSQGFCEAQPQFLAPHRPLELMGMERMIKEENDHEHANRIGNEKDVGESSSSMPNYHSYHPHHPHHHHHHHHHQDLNVAIYKGEENEGYLIISKIR